MKTMKKSSHATKTSNGSQLGASSFHDRPQGEQSGFNGPRFWSRGGPYSVCGDKKHCEIKDLIREMADAEQ